MSKEVTKVPELKKITNTEKNELLFNSSSEGGILG